MKGTIKREIRWYPKYKETEEHRECTKEAENPKNRRERKIIREENQQRNIAAVLIGAREERTTTPTKVGKHKRTPDKQTIDHNVSMPTDIRNTGNMKKQGDMNSSKENNHSTI